MHRRRTGAMILVIIAIILTHSLFAADHEYPVGTSAFERVWQRQDRAIDDRVATNRSWTWGFTRSPVLLEQFVDTTDGSGTRRVQYFDKSRMEINDPGGDEASRWYVTNGLLPIEMMTGQRQIGFSTFVDEPAAANITAIGNLDLNNPGRFFPTYADLAEIYQNPGSNGGSIGNPVTDMIEQDNEHLTMVTFDDYRDDPATILRSGQNGHGIAQTFLDFQQTRGPVYENSDYVTASVYDPLFVFGLPVTEPYWVRVDVGQRQQQPVLFQIFERRVLTYDPNEADPLFRVAMGNVGQHFFLWQYGDQELTPAPLIATATPDNAYPQPPTTTPSPTATEETSAGASATPTGTSEATASPQSATITASPTTTPSPTDEPTATNEPTFDPNPTPVPDPPGDVEWVGDFGNVADIQKAFNEARASDLTVTRLMNLPDQATWDAMSGGEKALWLINSERVDRGLMPLTAVEPNITSVAQLYAEYLLEHDASGHDADGKDPWIRITENPAINACHERLHYAENITYLVTTADSIPLAVERSVYGWMYDDSGSSWGHRHALLHTIFNDNSGPSGSEGFMGIGQASGGPYQGRFSRQWDHAEIVVLNFFDPCASW